MWSQRPRGNNCEDKQNQLWSSQFLVSRLGHAPLQQTVPTPRHFSAFPNSKLVRGINCHRWLGGAFGQHEKTSISMCQSTERGHEVIPSVGSWREQPSDGEDCKAGTYHQGWPYQRDVYDFLGIKGVTGLTSRSIVCVTHTDHSQSLQKSWI